MVKGGPADAASLPRRPPRGAQPEARRAAHRPRSDPAPAQRAPEADGRPPRWRRGRLATLDVRDERRYGGHGFRGRGDASRSTSSSRPCASCTRTSQDRPTSKRDTSSRGPGGRSTRCAAARDVDVRRAVTTVGPHRASRVDRRTCRTHPRVAGRAAIARRRCTRRPHVVANEIGAAPVLLLDDVFCELDPTALGRAARARAGRPGLPHDRGWTSARRHPETVVHVRAGELS